MQVKKTEGDKRKFLRLEVERLARCGKVDAKEQLRSNREITVEVVDLSPGGAGIVGDAEAVGSIIDKMDLIKLEIPFKDDLIVVNGRIMWTQRTPHCIKAGLQFDLLSEEVSKKLRMYLYDRAIRETCATATMYGCEEKSDD